MRMRNEVQVKAASRTRLGFSLGVLALGVLGEFVVFTQAEFIRQNGMLASGGVAMLGMAIWLAGHVQERSSSHIKPASGLKGQYQEVDHPLACFGNLKYWGRMLLLLAGVSGLITLYFQRPADLAVAARLVTRQVAAPRDEPFTFPPMLLQGIVDLPGRPSAVINGRTYFIGDYIGKVRVAEIHQESVQLIHEDQTNLLTFTNQTGLTIIR
ncbi:MAG: hypothetical protein IH623_02225 [Verrucomicrobia bacterium]|nr:hypothetical protein [Verrucomicrobiota bacterium]